MMQPDAPDAQSDQGSGPSGSAPALPPALTQMISALQAGMKRLGGLLEKANLADPDELQEFSQIVSQFDDFVTSLSSGQDDEQGEAQAPTPQSVSTPEAGGNPNARPM